MNMTPDDGRLLAELCEQHGASADKVRKPLDAVRDYEFKDRRTGVYDALREILKSKPAAKTERPALATVWTGIVSSRTRACWSSCAAR